MALNELIGTSLPEMLGVSLEEVRADLDGEPCYLLLRAFRSGMRDANGLSVERYDEDATRQGNNVAFVSVGWGTTWAHVNYYRVIIAPDSLRVVAVIYDDSDVYPV